MTGTLTEKNLHAASRRAAVVTALGAAAVMVSLVYAGNSLRETNASLYEAQTELEDTRVKLKDANETLIDTSKRAEDAQERLAQASCALQSSRSAIQAFHLRQYQTAAELYSQALMCDPSNAYLLNLMAYTQFKMQRLPDALAFERRSVEADPSYAWGYFDLARFLCATGSNEAQNARAAIERAIALRPDMRTIMRGDGEFMRLCRPIIGAF